MFALILVVLILILTVIYFHLKCSVMTALATLFAGLFGMIAALGYYELLADQLIKRGLLAGVALPLSLILVFVIVFALVRTASDFVVGSSMEFSPAVRMSTVLSTGLLTGLIIAGMVLITLVQLPLTPKLSYSRYDLAGSLRPDDPQKLLISADGLTAGLFSWMSQGSLSSGKSFAVLHANYVNQLHLNRFEGVYPVASPEAVIVPRRIGVRTREIDGRTFTVVRVGIKDREIKDGGARDPDSKLSFAPAQIRLVCQDKAQTEPLTGAATPVYPAGFVTGDTLEEKPLGEVIVVDREQIVSKPTGGRAAWYDVAFDVPANLTPILLEFKLNTIVELTRPVPGTEEVETQLEKGVPSEGTPEAGGEGV